MNEFTVQQRVVPESDLWFDIDARVSTLAEAQSIRDSFIAEDADNGHEFPGEKYRIVGRTRTEWAVVK